MRYGLQMYGLNPIFLQDKEGFLRRISAAGYRYLEPCLVLGDFPGMADHGWTEGDFAANAPVLKRYGVLTNSCHVFTQDIFADLPRIVAIAMEYGIAQIVLPCPKEINPAVAADLTQVGDALQRVGLQLLIHNDRGGLRLRLAADGHRPQCGCPGGCWLAERRRQGPGDLPVEIQKQSQIPTLQGF